MIRGCCSRDHMVVGLTTTCAINASFESRSWWGVLNTTLCDSMLFFPQAIFFFAQNKNQNIFWHKKSVKLKWSVPNIMVHTNVDLFIILLSYKYNIIFFSTPYLQCVISYCKCIQELFANNNNIENTRTSFFFQGQGL